MFADPAWVTDYSKTQSRDYYQSHNSWLLCGEKSHWDRDVGHGGTSGVADDMLHVDQGGGYHDVHLRAGFLKLSSFDIQARSFLGGGVLCVSQDVWQHP